ncbi:MAG: alpha/beta hydrolase, partial [Kofleriaceae bacterium]|nr:alpha/beta hydrolase [Kofleriaceae bacterium]
GPAGPLPVRVYVPHGAGSAMIVFFHGGGGVIGSVDSYDLTVRMLAARTGCVVASVDYRLAPEDPHPAAIEDAVAAWAWARAAAPRFGCDPARLAVAGDSFGGFLAAWVERRARDAGLGAPALTVLIYPLLDLTLTQPSIDTFADGFLLTRAMMTWFRGLYLPGDDAARRAASPLLLDDVRDAAPALIVTAGFDPLRDEGAAWAERLRATGARVTYRCHPELVHGFIGLTGGFRRADAATRALCDDVAAALGR